MEEVELKLRALLCYSKTIHYIDLLLNSNYFNFLNTYSRTRIFWGDIYIGQNFNYEYVSEEVFENIRFIKDELEKDYLYNDLKNIILTNIDITLTENKYFEILLSNLAVKIFWDYKKSENLDIDNYLLQPIEDNDESRIEIKNFIRSHERFPLTTLKEIDDSYE